MLPVCGFIVCFVFGCLLINGVCALFRCFGCCGCVVCRALIVGSYRVRCHVLFDGVRCVLIVVCCVLFIVVCRYVLLRFVCSLYVGCCLFGGWCASCVVVV